MQPVKIYEDFLGDWQLDVSSCVFEQSLPPLAGSYHVSEVSEGLLFRVGWTDAEGENHEYSFTGVPDGQPRPFAGGELADAMSVSAPSATELNSAAFFRGTMLMTATRRLVDAGSQMEVRQTVHLPDGSKPSNVARYRRKLHS